MVTIYVVFEHNEPKGKEIRCEARCSAAEEKPRPQSSSSRELGAGGACRRALLGGASSLPVTTANDCSFVGAIITLDVKMADVLNIKSSVY